MITVGDQFPDFKLIGADGQNISEYTQNIFTNKWTFIFFYPEDFSFVCPTEAKAFESVREEIESKGGQIFGISTDDADTHKSWIEELGIHYPLLSDDKYTLSKILGVLDKDNLCKRATFIISPEKTVEFITVTSRNVGRSIKETLRVFDAIQTGKMCPADFLLG